MSEIKINVKAKIFDDPEYCEDYVGKCEHLNDGRKDYCTLFCVDVWHMMLYRKCPECKKVWQNAKDASDPSKIQQRIDDDFFDSEYA